MSRYALQTVLPLDFDAAKTRVTEALKGQGFGILTEIDVQKTLKAKLGADIERLEILGACNPPLAHSVLSIEREIALLLPCNVTLRQVEGGTQVSILDPEIMFEVTDPEIREQISGTACDAKERLLQVLAILRSEFSEVSQ